MSQLNNSEFTMNSSMKRPARVRSKGGGLLAAGITMALAGLIAQPALADHDNDRGGRGRGDEHHRVEHRRYPVYRPEPIYYPRQESPGINLFIPLWNR
jgi:hypothetical protein